ncbi:uncharacterized protein ACRADG_005087 [Cochliomyia hominivorax]
MKLLYLVITLVSIQIVFLKSLEAVNFKSLAHDKLIDLYDKGMSEIDKEFAESCYNLSVNILKDNFIEMAATPIIRNFKQNIKDFLTNYPFYKRYGLYNNLVTIFSDIIMDYYYEQPQNDNDSQYISKLLKQLHYDDINTRYEEKFGKFIKETLCPEFEGFARKLPATENLKSKLLKWSAEVKQCQAYDCYDDHYDILIKILYSAKDELFDAIEEYLDNLNISYIIKAEKVLKSIYNDPKQKQLSLGWHRHLVRDIFYFLQNYETNTDIKKLDDLYEALYNISAKYYNNSRISAKDCQLLKDIFAKNGYNDLEQFKESQLNDFIQHDLYNIFEEYKSTLTKEDREKEKNLFQWYDHVKGLKSYEDKIKAFDQLLVKAE